MSATESHRRGLVSEVTSGHRRLVLSEQLVKPAREASEVRERLFRRGEEGELGAAAALEDHKQYAS